MPDKVKFYYNPMSRGRMVHWMLEEVGAEYEIQFLDWKKRDHKSPEYLKINPMGKIPAIIHRSTVITETPAICAYLADAFPSAGLAPEIHSADRGSYYRWLFFGAGCIEAAIFDKKYPRANSPQSSYLGYGSYDDTMNTLEKAVTNGYLVGNKFSAADLYISSQIGWALANKDIEAKPAFVLYHKMCTERPAFKRFMEKAAKIS